MRFVRVKCVCIARDRTGVRRMRAPCVSQRARRGDLRWRVLQDSGASVSSLSIGPSLPRSAMIKGRSKAGAASCVLLKDHSQKI
jgi:hypothetical protein